jgi:small GTP-binding protein
MMDQRNRLVEELEAIHGTLEARQEQALAEKAEAMAAKGREETLYVAFCGHFSAGKSSLINYLCGAALLPSSPIPTSANIVKIRSGDTSEAVLTYRDGREAHVPLADVSKHAKDGETVRNVELRHPIPLLGTHGILLDTPGVDSTDDMHRQATESALHLADAVFYVMDYNHVLSEMNMDFAKRLSEMGKPLVLVVNQIDKHREEEVPFEAFREGVAEAFRSWGVEPAACLYTTLKAPEHPHNEAPLLRELLGELTANGGALALSGLAAAAVELAREATRRERSRQEDRRTALERLAAAEDSDAAIRYESLTQELAARAAVRERLVESVKAEAGMIAANANITPATTRDAAQSFLESRQPGFRVGLLFAAAKTEEERRRRLEAFYNEFSEHVTARLVWHVRDAVKKAGLALGLDDKTVDAAAALVDAEVTRDGLVSKVKAGAVASGEYTLNYASEIANEVRSAVKRSAVAAAEQLAAAAEMHYAAERPVLEAEWAALDARLAHRRELAELDEALAAGEARLMARLPVATAVAHEQVPFPDVAALRRRRTEGRGIADASTEPATPKEAARVLDLSLAAMGRADAGANAVAGSDLRSRFDAAAETLLAASREAAELAPLASASKALRDKAKRLQEQRFTAALFGAFSAGKSSFANALLGENVLPVSPNPTTAAINTVVPPSPEWAHGTARVTMKTRAVMLGDVRRSLQALGAALPDGELGAADALKRIEALQKEAASVPPGGKPHLAFLRAFAAGWAEAEPLLGTDVRADRELFRAYVAEERKSAFVDRIALHYDSALSRQGVTLVDTPGADSINARHTGVAFNYMKNADAIFFVTYYNHAFSRADRQFLEQLGRVKDAFELDKMFFIVNAADLASNAEELEDVLEHVRQNLATFGVRYPRLFPVSSLRALGAKAAGDRGGIVKSGIAAFEDAFAGFAGGELAALAYRSAEAELRRTVGLLHTLLQGAKSGEADRRNALDRLEESESKAIALLRASDLESVRKDVLKETNEQLYYIKQRFMFRFGEWYTASFNPSVLREDRGEIKQSLGWAWRDLVDYIQTELVNEALAATLRIERFMNQSITGAVGRWNDALCRVTEAYDLKEWEELAFATPDIESVWGGEEPDLKLLSGHYRNARTFFEGDGRKSLREALEKRWQDGIADSLDKLSVRLADWVEAEVSQAREAAVERLEQTLADSIARARAAWEQPWDESDLAARLDHMKSLLDTFESTSRVRQ